MIKVLMHGCNGRMGQMIVNLVKEEKEMEIAAGVDKFDGVANDFPVFSCIGDCTVKADVVIDFSNAGAADELLDYLLIKLLKEAVPALAAAGFDIEIVEKHHNQKLDAPSGTAIALADAVNEAADGGYTYVYDRSQVRQKRGEKELGISAVRGGTIVGDHDVIFAGTDEVVTLEHRAYSRAVFGKGAVQAAKFLAGKPAGLYDMRDVIG